MDLNSSLDPYFLSDLDTFPVAEVGAHVEAAAREGALEALENLTSSLVDRALRALREGSQQDLLEEALAVSQGLSGEAGEALKERHPEIYGAWTALDDLLAEAGQRSDRAAIPGILKSTGKHGQRALELLAREGRPVPRAQILKELGIEESHLSHLLHHLEEADLILRFRLGKEVLVKLGPAGRDLVRTAVFPAWVESLLGALEGADRGNQIEASALTDELVKVGAPSRLVAERLGAALSRVASKVRELALQILVQPDNPKVESARSANDQCAATVPWYLERRQHHWASQSHWAS